MAVRRACVALCSCALAALSMIGCADLTRPDGAPRPDPAAAPRADRVAVMERPRPAAPKALDIVPLVPAPGRVPDVVPGSANPAPAAAAGGGGG